MPQVDTLIIGSGVAAAALSQRLLTANPHASILILEAGQKVKMKDMAIWQDYLINKKLPYTKYEDLDYPDKDNEGENQNCGQDTIPLKGARLFTYGGSTTHWGGWSFRLKPEDFNLYSNTQQGIDWPFNYEDLEPYYDEAEYYIGVSGDRADSGVPHHSQSPNNYLYPAFPFTLEDKKVKKAMEDLGISCTHLPIARRGVLANTAYADLPCKFQKIVDNTSRHAPCKTTGTCKYCPFGARYAAVNYLNDMKEWEDYPNFEIKPQCVVKNIDMVSKSQAKGVTYYDKLDKKEINIEANTIIVAAGTIESAKLLLRSTSETYWQNGIGNDHDLVGRNFITHPYFIFNATIDSNPDKLQPEMDFPTLCTRYFDSPEEQKGGKFILVNTPSSPSFQPAKLMQQGKTREHIDQALVGKHIIQLHGMIEVFSEAKNRITNSSKLNHIGLPETNVYYEKPEYFGDRMKEIKAHVEKIFEKMGASILSDSSISWRADHASCTCRMSDDPTQGVTDRNMKIHGVDNIYVCSNAAFSSLGTVNPTLTLTALSLRLGDHLLALNSNKEGA